MKRRRMAAVVVVSLWLVGAKDSFPEKGSAQDFAIWQKEARAIVADALYNGPVPEAVPLAVEYGQREARKNYELMAVTFYDRPGHTVHAWLARPFHPSGLKRPGVLALHGHDFGALDTFDPENMYYYGDLLARRGYVVFAPNIGHDFLEHEKPYLGFGPLPQHEPFPATGQKVWMARRSLDFLESLPEVDREKLGVVGLSNGGFIALFTAATDERVKLAVVSGCLIMHDRMWHRELFHCRCQYLPKLDGRLDYYDVAALIAPRFLFLQTGERDPIFPVNSARKAFAFIQKAYTLAGAPEHVYHDIHVGAHVFDAAVPLLWFEKHLPLPAGN